MERKRLQLDPWHPSRLQWVQSKRTSKDHQGIGMRWGHKPKLSLDKGLFLYSISLSKCSAILFNLSAIIVQLVYQWEIDLFVEVYEEVGIPKMVEGRPYSLGGFPKMWKQEAKGGWSWLFSQTTQDDLPTKFVSMETSPLYLKNIPKTTWHG